eukprot:1150895-Pelagomonas_calceolata.AAC.1
MPACVHLRACTCNDAYTTAAKRSTRGLLAPSFSRCLHVCTCVLAHATMPTFTRLRFLHTTDSIAAKFMRFSAVSAHFVLQRWVLCRATAPICQNEFSSTAVSVV